MNYYVMVTSQRTRNVLSYGRWQGMWAYFGPQKCPKICRYAEKYVAAKCLLKM